MGMEPQNALAKGWLLLDEDGSIITSKELRVRKDIPNPQFLAEQEFLRVKMAKDLAAVWAVGDVRSNSPRQLSAAVGDGCLAAMEAIEYLQKT